MLTRRKFLIASAVVITLPTSSFTNEPNIFARGGVAINGYDPVAYFTQSEPVKGNANHSVQWNGAIWHFATAANKDAFATNPNAYAPQYGGYCAYAVSKGATAKTEPDAWTVHNGKLYLNFDRNVRTIWRRDISDNISKADNNWPGVLG